MLKHRVITAVVLLALFLWSLFSLSPLLFSVFIGLVVFYASWEWSDMAGLQQIQSRLLYLAFTGVIMLLIATYIDFFGDMSQMLIAGKTVLLWAVLWWLVALFWVKGYPNSASIWGSVSCRLLMGLLVLIPTWVAVVILIHAINGPWLVLIVVAVVAFADIGAYFAGRRFGKTPLAPTVSPKKTIEGMAGGILVNVIFVIALGIWQQMGFGQWLLFVLVVAVAVPFSVLGDLLESMVKRHRGIKDSGNILPGHGGLLDRMDSLTAALPIFALLYTLNVVRL